MKTMNRLLFAAWLILGDAAAMGQELAAGPKLTLDDAIRLVLDKNQSIKVDTFSRAIARADLLAAEGQFDPAVNFSRRYSEDATPAVADPPIPFLTKTDTYSLSLGFSMPWGGTYSLAGQATGDRVLGNPLANQYASFGGITVTQPLLRGFGFGANLLTVRLAKADRAISDWTFRQTVMDAVRAAIFAYSDLVLAHENLRIAQRTRELAAGSLAESEKRYKVGFYSESDTTQARAQVASREEGILLAQRAVRDRDNALRQLMGEGTFSLSGPLLVIETPAAADIDAEPARDLKKAYELRPDYQATRLGLVRYRATEISARNQLLPQVDVVGSYGYSGLDADFATSRRMVGNEENRSYSAGVVVTVPLTFAEGRGRASAARLSLRQAEASLQLLEQAIALSVTTAAGQIETARERVKATRVSSDLANQALDAGQKKLLAGTGSTFEILSLQLNVSGAESSMYGAIADLRRAIANYEHETGTTLERHHLSVGY